MNQMALNVIRLSAEHPPPEGSCLFTENSLPGCLDRGLEWITGSPLSHVMILLYHEGQPFIYEAFPPVVLKVSWAVFMEKVLPKRADRRWTKRLGGLNAVWWSPQVSFDEGTLTCMRAEAEAWLGTKYSMVWNWLRVDNPKVHCSEFVGYVCEAGGFLTCDKGKETPGSLFNKLLQCGW